MIDGEDWAAWRVRGLRDAGEEGASVAFFSENGRPIVVVKRANGAIERQPRDLLKVASEACAALSSGGKHPLAEELAQAVAIACVEGVTPHRCGIPDEIRAMAERFPTVSIMLNVIADAIDPTQPLGGSPYARALAAALDALKAAGRARPH